MEEKGTTRLVEIEARKWKGFVRAGERGSIERARSKAHKEGRKTRKAFGPRWPGILGARGFSSRRRRSLWQGAGNARGSFEEHTAATAVTIFHERRGKGHA